MGDKVDDVGRDLEGSVRNVSKDVRSEVEKFGVSFCLFLKFILIIYFRVVCLFYCFGWCCCCYMVVGLC